MEQHNISREWFLGAEITALLFILLFMACNRRDNVMAKVYSVSKGEYSYDVFDTIKNEHSFFDEKYNLNLIYSYHDFIQNDTGRIEIADNLWLNIHNRFMFDNQEIVCLSENYGTAGWYMLYTKDYGIFYLSDDHNHFKIRLKKIIKKGKEIDLTEINNFMDSTILKPPPVPPAPILDDYE